MTVKKKRAAALLLGLSLVAAACGSSDEATDASQDAPTTEAAATTDEAMEDEAMEDEAAATDEAMEDEAMEDEAMEDGDFPTLDVSFDGLEPLGDDFDYEVWAIVEDTPVSGGIFDIDDSGAVVISGDQSELHGHDGATAVVITIEPAVGDEPAPSDTHILAGDVADDGSFELRIDHPAALGTDFSTAAGGFILGTPTNDPDGEELSGVWFLSVPGPETSLDLPVLPAGWAYEGWAVIDGQPISTGRFLSANEADDFAGFSGPNAGPDFPGEDFIINAPDGLSFPTDLSTATIVVSVEPDADNSPEPFALKPLISEVPSGTSDHENVALGAGSVAVSGSGAIAG